MKLCSCCLTSVLDDCQVPYDHIPNLGRESKNALASSFSRRDCWFLDGERQLFCIFTSSILILEDGYKTHKKTRGTATLYDEGFGSSSRFRCCPFWRYRFSFQPNQRFASFVYTIGCLKVFVSRAIMQPRTIPPSNSPHSETKRNIFGATGIKKPLTFL